MTNPVARSTDPQTSWDAARSVKHLRESQALILATLAMMGPATDDDLYEQPRIGKTMSPSGARTRRKELCELGLVEDSGFRGTTNSGRRCIVWRITEPAMTAIGTTALQAELPL